jgi:predicted Zn-ribbon and HTH transcriptional regulator
VRELNITGTLGVFVTERYDMKKKTKAEFLEQAKAVHGEKLDFGKAVYVNNREKVIVRCAQNDDHGEYSVTANHLLNGSGCPKCAIEANANSKRKTPEQFLSEVEEIHEGKLDFSEAKYVGVHAKVKASCLQDLDHGKFSATPSSLLQGHGCPKCGTEAGADELRKTPEQFLREVEDVHGGKLDFSSAKYVNNQTKVTVSCLQNLDHGGFSVTPHSLLKGSGCPKCRSSRGEDAIMTYLCDRKVPFDAEKTFDDLVGDKNWKLRYDFHLPEENLLIEFDGKQHFEANSFFGGEEAFARTQKSDQIKNDYALEHGIRLLRIRYDEIDDISSILDDALGHQDAV